MPAFDLQNYISVQERINQFWKDHPDGAIRTRLMSDPADFDRCRYEARVYTHRDHPEPDATGYAFELAGSGMANKTSHEENCETSAIGRALANLAYATTQETRPSREEMVKAAKSVPDADANALPNPNPRTKPPSQFHPESSEAIARSHQIATNASPIDVGTARLRRLHAVAKERGLSHDELHAIAKGRGKESLKDLTPAEMDTFTNWLEKVSPPALQVAIDAGRELAPTK